MIAEIFTCERNPLPVPPFIWEIQVQVIYYPIFGHAAMGQRKLTAGRFISRRHLALVHNLHPTPT
jgi:hypothetical protein